MPEIHILPTSEETAQGSAEFVVSLAKKQAHTQGRFTIALSGGSTPQRLYEMLASPTYEKRIEWNQWQVFWGDERCVPPYHDDSNYRMIKEVFLDRLHCPEKHIHRMRGEARPQDAAEEYERELRQLFSPSSPIFDLILLGIGEDGHTASLFAGTPALDEGERLVVANWVQHFQVYRITFTLPLINAAHAVAFLVTEESKAGILKEVLQPSSAVPPPPAALVRPATGNLHWFLTKAAAGELER